MKEYSCGFFACVFTEAIMRENGWTGEGGKIAAAGRNSWTSDRLPDESSGVCVKIKRKEREARVPRLNSE